MDHIKETCKCPIDDTMSYEELRALIKENCRAPQYLCPKFDRLLVRAKKEHDLREAYNKRRSARSQNRKEAVEG